MGNQWQVEEGTGWIAIPEFGEINPRRDSVTGGRQYFTAKVDNGEHAKVTGEFISGGPETCTSSSISRSGSRTGAIGA